MQIRAYQSEDCPSMAQLFYDTVHAVNIKDYSKEQVDAWATGHIDLKGWDASFHSHIALVAEEAGRIVGFGDIDASGYLDRLYIHKDYQGRGIATALCDALEAAVSAPVLSVHASITARPFFERRGYKVVKEQQVERLGVLLTNYVMEKEQPVAPEKPVIHYNRKTKVRLIAGIVLGIIAIGSLGLFAWQYDPQTMAGAFWVVLLLGAAALLVGAVLVWQVWRK